MIVAIACILIISIIVIGLGIAGAIKTCQGFSELYNDCRDIRGK